MSYRELRNFTEMLRALNYPRQVSVDNFRTPNFKLVAEILLWLIQKYDPDYDGTLLIDTEQDRVIFIKTCCLFLIQKARIKANPKKLYQADGYAVQELLKVATVLYEAATALNKVAASTESSIVTDAGTVAKLTTDINAKLGDLRVSRQLAAEIPEHGAVLYDLLNKEVDLRERRMAALARPLELADVEKSIKAYIRSIEDETRQTFASLNNISADEATLDSKIEKKRADLDRQQKRLIQLQSHRPAYMDEYEKLETELKSMYSLYVLQFRNIAHLEQQQAEFDRVEQEQNMEAELNLRRLAERVREEEQKWLAATTGELSGTPVNATSALDSSDATQNQFRGTSGQHVAIRDSMTGAGLSDDDSDSEGDMGDEPPDSDDDDDDDQLTDTQAPPNAPSVGRGSAHVSDERPSAAVTRPGAAAATTGAADDSSAAAAKQLAQGEQLAEDDEDDSDDAF